MSLEEKLQLLLVEQIKNMPQILQESIINKSIDEIRKQIRKEIILEIVEECEITVNEVAQDIINNNNYWQRKEYTRHIDNDIYQVFVRAAQIFVENMNNQIISNTEF
jgi:hypothetical protein